MERSLVLGSLAIGGIGWACALVLAWLWSRPGESAPPAGNFGFAKAARPFRWLAALLPLAVWAMTLPVAPPFSPGQGWGRGFLLGGAGALAGATPLLLARCGGGSDGLAWRAASIAPLLAALPVVAVPLLWMRASVIDALSGAAAGWLAVSFLLLLGSACATARKTVGEEAANETNETPSSRDASPSSAHLIALPLANGAGFAVTLCAACALGVYRDFIVADVARGTHSAVALALACGGPIVLLCGALLQEIVGASRSSVRFASSHSSSSRALFASDAVASVLLTAVTLLALAYLLATRVLEEPSVFSAVGIGLLMAFIAWWMARDGETGVFAAPPLAVLVALCGFMASYQLLQGFGVGLMLLAAWPVAVLAAPASSSRESSSKLDGAPAESSKLDGAPLEGSPGATPEASLSEALPDAASAQRHDRALMISLLLLFVTILLLSRLFAMRFRADLRGVSLSDHYALFGFLAGATLPALLAAPLLRALNDSSRPAIALSIFLRLVFASALALAVPGAMLALWGAKCAPALLAGLALAAVLGSSAAMPRSHRFQSLQSLLCALLALAVAWLLTQWTGHGLPLSEDSRAERLRALLWGGGLLAALLLLADYGARLANGLSKRRKAA